MHDKDQEQCRVHDMNMDEDKKLQLEKAKKKVDTANKCRLTFLFIAVIGLVFIYFGNKIWDGISWYDQTVAHLYIALFADIFLMLVSTLIKFYLVMRYNRIVKSL